MAATYPDLFRAAIPCSGVNAGCFVSSSGGIDAWNSTCAHGQSIATPATWAAVAKAMYPGYKKTRPRMQIYHGSMDATLRPQNYQETMKKWAGGLEYDYDKPQSVKANDPQSGYTRTVYGPSVHTGHLCAGGGAYGADSWGRRYEVFWVCLTVGWG